MAAGNFITNLPTHTISFHRLSSVTPIELPLDPDETVRKKQMEEVLARVLGKDETLEGQPIRRFTRLCFQAVIFNGQGDLEQCSLNIDAAVRAFNDILANDSKSPIVLQALNQMSFLLHIYGQKAFKARITETLIQNLQVHDEETLFVIKGTLEFIREMTNWNESNIAYHLQKACDVSQQATKSTTENSPFSLCASYNAGWVLLEVGHYEKAVHLLALGRAKAENAFGPDALETILWIATLAQAHFRNEELSTAEFLMKETVVVRVEEAYSQEHAFYWEMQYRVGLFYVQMADKRCESEKKTEHWAMGEELLRKTLFWRALELGPDNPQTTIAYNWLKFCLERQGKIEEAHGLFALYRQGTIS